ncbi:MAG TPA: OmpA family protein [Kofleriaceae bacterium]
MKTMTLLLAIVAAAGCSHDKKKVEQPTTDVNNKSAGGPDKPAPVVTNDAQVSPGLAVSGDIAQMCGIKPAASTKTSPQFDYDKDELTPEDRAVLDQLASCLTQGALKGKAIALIGRADPRGTEEYNLGLGSRRAASVSTYLGRLGVGQPQLAVTTRGALEATGSDEAGWKQDRRVDIQLKTDSN